MLRRPSRPQPDRIEVHIGPNANMTGNIKCDGSVKIDGVFDGGHIETLGNVIIGSEARVLADIKARTVSVAGAYRGELNAQRLELLEGGQIWGVIRVASFLLDDDAFMHGELIMVKDGEEEPIFPASPAVKESKPLVESVDLAAE
ncbi:MAG: polymer-forming cytoskeletal protein [Caldilineales bacterium]|nr:polymer-forming cytoskeletal protein [Caldilineales bacterium]